MRFLTPILFAAGAGYVAWYNAQHSDRALVLPFMDVLDPAAATDPSRQGELTVWVLTGIAVITGVLAVVGLVRERGEG